MEKITVKTELDEYTSRLFDMYFGGMRFASFDIETTGLMRTRDHVILTGFCEVSGGTATVTQYLAESIEDEALTLETTLEKLAELDMVVTYNGRRFDMPFVYERSDALGIPVPRKPFDFDLYPAVKKHSAIGDFTPNLKQTTLETFMGLWHLRTDTIDGGKSVMMYYDWLSSRDDILQEKILLHNHDDVLQLYRLLGALGRVDMHSAMRGCGFPLMIGETDPAAIVTIGRSSLRDGTLVIGGRLPDENAPYGTYIDYGLDGPSVKLGPDGRFTIMAEASEKEGFTLIDLDDLGIGADEIPDAAAAGSGYLVLATPAGENDLEMNTISRLLAERMIGKMNIF